jgi:hypothetical protein
MLEGSAVSVLERSSLEVKVLVLLLDVVGLLAGVVVKGV